MIGGPGASHVVGAAASAARRAADGQFDPAAVDDVDVIVRSLVQAADEGRRLAEPAAVTSPQPRDVTSIPGVLDGVPVLDPDRSTELVRDQLAQYAPVLRIGEGSLHLDGAPVQRDVARWLGHPVAQHVFPDGSDVLVHAEHQVGNSAGYGSLDEARFAAEQLLGPGPAGRDAVQGVALLPIRDDAGRGRYALASVDAVPARSREEQGFWGGRVESTQQAVESRALTYRVEDGQADPASELIDRARGQMHLDSGVRPPVADARSLIPSAELDALSVVGRDVDALARRAEHEQWTASLEQRLRQLADDPVVVERIRTPKFAARLAKAEQVMAAVQLDTSSGWSTEHLRGFRDALITSGLDHAGAERAMAHVSTFADRLLRDQIWLYYTDFTVTPGLDVRTVVDGPLDITGRAHLLTGALANPSHPSGEMLAGITTQLDKVMGIASGPHATPASRAESLQRLPSGARAAYVEGVGRALAVPRPIYEMSEIGTAVAAANLPPELAARVTGRALGAGLPSGDAARVAAAAIASSSDIAGVEGRVVAALRRAERELDREAAP